MPALYDSQRVRHLCHRGRGGQSRCSWMFNSFSGSLCQSQCFTPIDGRTSALGVLGPAFTPGRSDILATDSSLFLPLSGPFTGLLDFARIRMFPFVLSNKDSRPAL